MSRLFTLLTWRLGFHARRCAFLALAIFAVAGCDSGQDVTTRAIANARRTWEHAGIRNYDLEWTSRGTRDEHYFVYVRDGKVQAVRRVARDPGTGKPIVLTAHPADPSYYGVEGLFEVMDEELKLALDENPFGQPKGSRVVLKFTPDAKLGYPHDYRRDVSGAALSLAIDVLKFDPNPQGDVPPLPPPP